MEKWKATPKHILRKECVKHLLKSLAPGEFIEFGAGTGDFTAMFLERGFPGTCYDLGDENRQILRENLKDYKDVLTVVDSPAEIGKKKFDYLLSFEVLEHIEDDAAVFEEWTSHLKPKGKLIISVPAHQMKYSREDDFHGHVRRYEKKELYDLIKGAGYKNIRILNYGFPLGNITRIFSALLFKFLSGNETVMHSKLSAEERSIKSGVQRHGKTLKFSFLFNKLFLFPFLIIQRLFFGLDLGDGYVAYAEKI